MPERSTSSLASSSCSGHVVVVGGVDQLGQLVLQRGHQLGVVVAQGVDGDAAQRVQVFACRSCPTRGSLGHGVRAMGRRP